MAAITSTAAGAWSAGGTWVGGVAPGNGDSATVAHAVTVDANTIVGTSGAAGTLDLTVQTAGSLTVNAGISLTVRGDTQIQDTSLTLAAGASFLFGNGGSAQRYRVRFGPTGSLNSSRFVATGTSGSRCTIGKEASAGNGSFGPNTDSNSIRSGVTITYTDIADVGAASTGYQNDAFDLNCVGTNQKVSFTNVTIARCGRIGHTRVAVPADCDVNVASVEVTAPLLATTAGAFHITMTATTTGVRVWQNISALGSSLFFTGSHKGATIQNVCAARYSDTASTDFSAATIYKNILQAADSDIQPTVGAPSSGGETITNMVFLWCGTGQAQIGMNGLLPASTGAAEVTYDNVVVQMAGDTEEMDALQVPETSGTGPFTYRQRNWIILPNARLGESCNGLSSHGTIKTSMDPQFCTFMPGDRAVANAVGGVIMGGAFSCFPGMLAAAKNNAFYRPTAGANGRNVPYVLYHGTRYETCTSGAAISATSSAFSSVLDPESNARSFDTATNQTLADSQAKLVVRTFVASGPAIGEEVAILTNTASACTHAALSAPLQTGQVARIIVVDVCAPGNMNYNGYVNCSDATVAHQVLDATGANAVTKRGYSGFSLSSTAIGANDKDFGTGIALSTVFHDYTRDLVGFYGFLVGKGLKSAALGAWTTATAYALGDIITDSQAAAWGSRTIYWYCRTAHTSGSTTRPISGGSTWETYWVPATTYALARDSYLGNTYTFTDTNLTVTALPPIEAVLAYVRSGYMPIAGSIWIDAASDGTDIGAVQYVASGGSLLLTMRSYGAN